MIPGLVVQGAKCRVGGSLGGRDIVPLAQVTEGHGINCVVPGKHCAGSAVAARAGGLLSGTSRFSCSGTGQEAVMARVGGVHTPGCGDQLQVPV